MPAGFVCISNLVPRVSWLSDKEEGVFLHIKKPTCSGNQVVYLVTAVKIELRTLTQVSHVTKKLKK